MRFLHFASVVSLTWVLAISLLFFALPSTNTEYKETQALRKDHRFYVSKIEHETVPRECSIAIAIISHAGAVHERDVVRQTWVSSFKLYG